MYEGDVDDGGNRTLGPTVVISFAVSCTIIDAVLSTN